MKTTKCTFLVALCLASFTACTSDPSPAPTDAGQDIPPSPPLDAKGPDSAGVPDATIPHAARCASTFGSGLTVGFGRLDGVVRAVVLPTDTQCTWFNNDHVVVQVDLGGQAHRMVVNAASTSGGDPRVRLAEVRHGLPFPAWSEGWHPNAQIDYVLTLGVHTDAFTPRTLEELSTALASAITVGSRVSVYATSGEGRPESAHLIHRNGRANDGAIVLEPDGPSPRWLLFHFADQSF